MSRRHCRQIQHGGNVPKYKPKGHGKFTTVSPASQIDQSAKSPPRALFNPAFSARSIAGACADPQRAALQEDWSR